MRTLYSTYGEFLRLHLAGKFSGGQFFAFAFGRKISRWAIFAFAFYRKIFRYSNLATGKFFGFTGKKGGFTGLNISVGLPDFFESLADMSSNWAPAKGATFPTEGR